MDDDHRYGFASVLVWAMRLLAMLPLLAGCNSLLTLADAAQVGAQHALQSPIVQVREGFAGMAMIGFWCAALLLLGLAELVRIAVDIEANSRRAADDQSMERARRRSAPEDLEVFAR